MNLKKRVPSGREKDQETIELLARLRDKVYCDNPSAARHAAFNLSWMQEDGLDILKEALYGNAGRATKGAAAYGLRKMRGRMRKPAMTLLEDGVRHSNEGTRQVCARALLLEKESKQTSAQQQQSSQPQPRFQGKPKFRISEMPGRRPQIRSPRYSPKRPPPRESNFNR